MTDEELAAALDTLKWSNRGLAAMLHCDERLVRRWIAGQTAVPEPVGAWLTECARLIAAVHLPPAPEAWRPGRWPDRAAG